MDATKKPPQGQDANHLYDLYKVFSDRDQARMIQLHSAMRMFVTLEVAIIGGTIGLVKSDLDWWPRSGVSTSLILVMSGILTLVLGWVARREILDTHKHWLRTIVGKSFLERELGLWAACSNAPSTGHQPSTVWNGDRALVPLCYQQKLTSEHVKELCPGQWDVKHGTKFTFNTKLIYFLTSGAGLLFLFAGGIGLFVRYFC